MIRRAFTLLLIPATLAFPCGAVATDYINADPLYIHYVHSELPEHNVIEAPVVFQDVLDTPASKSKLAANSILNGVTRAGNRLVSVGQRGHIIYSDDMGKTWNQARVPVSSDLVAIHFSSTLKGWAVGHDGVVLHSFDGGANWTKQFDGRAAAQVMVSYYTATQLPESEENLRLIEDVRLFAEQGPDKPFLDVWFEDENNGFIVGAFNLIFKTMDGGRSWEPWFHRTENPYLLHLYAIRSVGGDLFIAGEQGLVLKLDQQTGRFQEMQTPYKGTFFGIIGHQGSVIAFGLRGNAFRSDDGGGSWVKVETGVPVGLTGATTMEDGRIVLVSQGGHVAVSSDEGKSFQPVKVDKPTAASAVASLGKALVLVGIRGVHVTGIK